MKIDWKSKNTKIVLIIVAVIIVPILINQGNSVKNALLMQYQMSQPKIVQVACPEEREINPEFETTGRIEAKYSVNIIARISGWLQKRYFEEGDIVKKGQKLFTIEPDEYMFNAKNAQATVNENRAVFKNAQIEYNRAKQLLKEDLVSHEYYDNALATRNQTRAALDGSIEQLNKARLDLSYTNITSPMDGRIGQVVITEGNYVNPSSGTIATIYSTTPMKVIFTLKSADFIQMKKYYLAKKDISKSEGLGIVDVQLKLADGSIYDRAGKIEFMDNKIDESTGAFTLRAIFDNPNEILVPGDYVNVILKIRRPHKVMLVPQSATKTDVGTGYYVWVAKDGQAVKKDIVVSDNIDNNWVVESGLDYTDQVIVKGIQNIYKTGQKIKIEKYTPDAKDSESKVK